MKRYPPSLRRDWPSLGSLRFDPDSDLAKSFLAFPPDAWDGMREDKRTALGWVVSRCSWRGWHADQVAWARHLLAAGASPTHPFERVPDYSWKAERHFLETAWENGDTKMLEAMEDLGMPLFGPRHCLDFRSVARRHRMGWVKAFFVQPVGAERASIDVVVDDTQAPLAFRKEAIAWLRARGVQWVRYKDYGACLAQLWAWALSSGDRQVLQWAQEAWDERPPTELPLGWGRLLGIHLVRVGGEPSSIAAVRAALEARVPEADRAAWLPALPSPEDEGSALTLREWEAPQWHRVLALVQWARAWNAPPRLRDSMGVPWGLAIARQIHKGMQWRHAFPEEIAWRCIEELVLSGHVTTAKVLTRRSKKSKLERLGIAPPTPSELYHSSATLDRLFRSNNLVFFPPFGQWRDRYGAAKRARRILLATQGLPLAPEKKKAPRF